MLARPLNAKSTRRVNHAKTESIDGGKTWTTPQPIGVWGLPSHLLRIDSGRLLMTYGYRREPFGNQARLSVDVKLRDIASMRIEIEHAAA